MPSWLCQQLCPRGFSALVGAESSSHGNHKVGRVPVHNARVSFKKAVEGQQEWAAQLAEGHWVRITGYVLETAVAAQDVAPGLAD